MQGGICWAEVGLCGWLCDLHDMLHSCNAIAYTILVCRSNSGILEIWTYHQYALSPDPLAARRGVVDESTYRP